MRIIPIKVEYDFAASNHGMSAVVKHNGESREIVFFFDDKQIGQATVPEGSILTDDDYVCDIVNDYCDKNVGVFTDLIKNHSDKISLTRKYIKVDLEINGVIINTEINENRECYRFEMSLNGGEDKINGTIKSSDFSEVFEKMRLLIGTMASLSSTMADNINELTSDEVKQWIKWK